MIYKINDEHSKNLTTNTYISHRIAISIKMHILNLDRYKLDCMFNCAIYYMLALLCLILVSSFHQCLLKNILTIILNFKMHIYYSQGFSLFCLLISYLCILKCE